MPRYTLPNEPSPICTPRFHAIGTGASALGVIEAEVRVLNESEELSTHDTALCAESAEACLPAAGAARCGLVSTLRPG